MYAFPICHCLNDSKNKETVLFYGIRTLNSFGPVIRSHVVSFFFSSGDNDNFVMDGDLMFTDLKGVVNALED